MMTSSEDHAHALDVEAHKKHTTFSDGSTSFFSVARPVEVANAMQLEEVEVGADAVPKYSA